MKRCRDLQIKTSSGYRLATSQTRSRSVPPATCHHPRHLRQRASPHRHRKPLSPRVPSPPNWLLPQPRWSPTPPAQRSRNRNPRPPHPHLPRNPWRTTCPRPSPLIPPKQRPSWHVRSQLRKLLPSQSPQWPRIRRHRFHHLLLHRPWRRKIRHQPPSPLPPLSRPSPRPLLSPRCQPWPVLHRHLHLPHKHRMSRGSSPCPIQLPRR